MLPLELRLTIDLRAGGDFAERLAQDPYKRRVEDALTQFHDALVGAMDGELAMGRYRFEEVFSLPVYYVDPERATDDD